MNNILEIEIGYLIKNVWNLEELKNKPNLYVRDVFENKEEFIYTVKENTRKNIYENNYFCGEIFHIEGIFIMKYKNKTIIPIENFDYVPELIVYFLNALEECIEQKESEFSYPDQPLEVRLELNDNYIILVVENNSYRIEKDLFLKIFLEKAKMFFEIIRYGIGVSSYGYELKKIDDLYKIYNLSDKK